MSHTPLLWEAVVPRLAELHLPRLRSGLMRSTFYRVKDHTYLCSLLNLVGLNSDFLCGLASCADTPLLSLDKLLHTEATECTDVLFKKTTGGRELK